jgi:WD40 repeat protein
LWDLTTGKSLHTFAGEKPFNHVSFTPDGKGAASGNWYAGVETYDLLKPAVAGPLKGAAGHVFFVVYSPDGKQLATVGPEGLVIVWDLASARRLYTWPMAEDVRRLAFTSDGRHLVLGLGTGPVYIVRINSPKQ